MQDTRASHTAGYVAALRGLGSLLPHAGQLVDDPWGARWTGSDRVREAAARAPRLSGWISRPAWRELLYMQVRTHALDEAVRECARRGGNQLVLLGAGFDARALRLRGLGLNVFEVDHPATQARKKDVIGNASSLIPWDFERDPLNLLPARLSATGYERDRIGCVLWEGVTMYLTASAIDDSVAMIHSLLAPGSTLAFTYFTRARLESPSLKTRLLRRVVARGGEPWRFGWEPSELGPWLGARGFDLERDDETASLGRTYLPADLAGRLRVDERRIAVARRTA